ncbi:MAG: FtsX-like permease family protein, partial [Euryarchaeota archaeon]|nr:FtsX-like permease family protein [Euryarchaeota archaeon]
MDPSRTGGDALAILPQALRSVIRNRRRTFSSILGVLLAITFIAGTFIAIDSAARGALNALLADVPGDFTVSTNRDSLGTLEEDVAAVPGVQSVVPVARLQMFEVGVWNRTVVTAEALAIDPANPPSPVAGGTVRGAMTLARGLVVLTEGAASLLDVAVGDAVYLRPWYGFFDANLSAGAVNVTVEGILTLPADPLPFIGRPGYKPALVLLHVRDVDWIRTEAAIPYPPFWQLEVWIDRDRFIDPYDFEATTRNLGRLQRQIEAAAINQGAYVSDNISNALLTYQASLGSQRIIFLLLSTPVILLGLYLGAVGVDLGHAERRRELAVLKTRGAGRRQVIVLLLTEAVLGGLLAAVAGLALGVLLSRFVLSYVNPTFSAFVQAQYGDIVLSTDTILTVAVLSMLFMAAVSYRSAKRTAGLPIVETLRYYAPGETKIEYRPTADLIMVNLGVLTYAVVLYSRASPGGFFLFLVGVIFTVLLPFAPIFLTIGATRLATRSTGRVYEWASRACKPFAKNLYNVINRNLSRNPRRSANIAVIIALGLAFGVFTLAVLGSQQAYEVRQIRAGIGADAAIFGGTNDTVTADVRALLGVAGVTRVAAVPADSRLCCPGVWAVEPVTFFAVTQPEPWYFDGIGPAEAHAVLATKGQVLVSKAFADQA